MSFLLCNITLAYLEVQEYKDDEYNPSINSNYRWDLEQERFKKLDRDWAATIWELENRPNPYVNVTIDPFALDGDDPDSPF